jgi:hypothetical protein
VAKKARYTLTPGAVNLIATGKVAPAVDWTVDVAPGAPRVQRRDFDTGLPVWLVDCLDESDPEAGRASVVSVEVTSPTEPAPAKYQPLELSAVSVSLYVDKRGQLVVSYVGMLKSMSPARSGGSAAA